MESPSATAKPIEAASKEVASQLLIIGENRLELLAVELQEERGRLLHGVLMVLGVAAFGMLAGITFTALMVVWLWPCSPVLVLLTLTLLHGVCGGWLYLRLTRLLRNWAPLSATIDQLRKDRACFGNGLE